MGGLGPLKDTRPLGHPLSSLHRAEASKPGPGAGLAVCSCPPHAHVPGATRRCAPGRAAAPVTSGRHTGRQAIAHVRPPPSNHTDGGRQAPGLASWLPGDESQAV